MAVTGMYSFKTNDNVMLRYIDTGAEDANEREKPWFIFIHGFTGSSLVWQRNIRAFTTHYRVIVPDLRGHGASDKSKHGFQVSRLAMDLKELMMFLDEGKGREWKAVGGSLGCAILWCYASLFTTHPFTHTIFVDQAPLQNSDPSTGWDHNFCNRGMNSPTALAGLQTTLALSPETAHKGTIAACLSYRAYPLPTDTTKAGSETWKGDEAFFLGEAMKGDPTWLGRLMGDHTALDWRESIVATCGPESDSKTKVLVVTSTRSGCFPAAGPLSVVGLVNGEGGGGGGGGGEKRAKGVAVEWGGHWCYWEDPERFNKLCLTWLETDDLVYV